MAHITMHSLISPERVLPSLGERDFRHAIEEMIGTIVGDAFLDLPTAQEAVLTRSHASPSALGRGVALPHAVIPGLDYPLGTFARLTSPLDLDAPDALPVDLVLMILSPEGDEPALLQALACAARRLRDRDVASRLRSADGREAIYALLTSDGWRTGEQTVLSDDACHAGDLTIAAKCPTIGASC